MRYSQPHSILNTSTAHGQNRRTVLSCIRTSGPLSGADLSRRLDVPSGTITRVLSSLRSDGLLRARQCRENRGVGRPPTLLDVNPEFAHFVGVELGAFCTRIVLTDFKGGICGKDLFPTEDLPAPVVPALAERVVEFVGQRLGRGNIDSLRGIGVGVCGDVSLENGTIFGGFLPDGTQLFSGLQDAVSGTVQVDNDANMAVSAECLFGAGRGLKHVVCLLDRGWVGSGLVLNGALYRGKHNAAGELSAPMAGDPGERGGRQAHPPFLESLWLERAIREKNYPLDREDFPTRAHMIRALCADARGGSEQALEIIEGQTELLARALQRTGVLFDPEIIVLSGDWTEMGEFGEQMIRERLEQLWQSPGGIRKLEVPSVSFSDLGQEAVSLGAAASAIEAVSAEVSCAGAG